MARHKEKEVVIDTLGRKHTYKIDKKTGKKKTGRPTKFTEELIKKLEDLFSQDVELGRACRFVGISEQAYYDECKRNPQFLERMEKAQEYVGIIADRTIAKAIRDGDVNSARKRKDKRDERYKQKPTQINMQQGVDPETGEATQGLMVEFTIKD